MDQKRFILFIVLSLGILIGWNTFVVPRFFPPAKKPANVAEQKDGKPAADGAEAKPGDVAAAEGTEKKDAEVGPAPKAEPEATPEANVAEGATPPAANKQPAAAKAPEFPDRVIQLGSIDPKSDFRQLVTVTAHGAAIQEIELNDPRYRELTNPQKPLAVVGNGAPLMNTFELTVPQLGAGLNNVNWEVVELKPELPPHTRVVFRQQVQGLEILRSYEIGRVDRQAPSNEAPAYEIAGEIRLVNHSDKQRIVNYVLQGPVALPLENVDNTRKFRDVVVGFPDKGPEWVTAKAVSDGKAEQWTVSPNYIGVDVQYFAALILPVENQTETPYFKEIQQKLVGPNQGDKSDVTVEMTSVDLQLPAAKNGQPGKAVSHSFRIFAGPKRDDVLPPGTNHVIDFGMFHLISRPMLGLLKFFHALFGSWGIAIMCLTVCVRGAMFPISIKQARGAAKMQEIAPEIQALKEKYKNDKEKFARAQMELFSKHNYNPLAGCLPLFLQLPIFMGLYQSLNMAVDLRAAPFLWIDNLAAPDALFALPFVVPFFGWKAFNILPLFTVALFIVQQKMMMPPAANEEQAMQQKMMTYMTVFMGVMFYTVPAGLCVYFIASSIWGLAERKLLPKAKPGVVPPGTPTSGSSGGSSGPGGSPRKPDDDGSKSGGGLWGALLKAAEKQQAARRETTARRK
jgi:YidC/Oxa1 family membrane protein insertase